jgi:hypothetical protein
MRLPKQSLPKEVSKHTKQSKHKKALTKLENRMKKKLSKSGMDIAEACTVQEDKISTTLLSPEEKRKKVSYKKNNYSITGKNGPRAVSR